MERSVPVIFSADLNCILLLFYFSNTVYSDVADGPIMMEVIVYWQFSYSVLCV